MLIEPPIYLTALMQDFLIAGGKVQVREFHETEEISRLLERLVFNCTGLGAKALFKDEELTPVKGQTDFFVAAAGDRVLGRSRTPIYVFAARRNCIGRHA